MTDCQSPGRPSSHRPTGTAECAPEALDVGGRHATGPCGVVDVTVDPTVSRHTPCCEPVTHNARYSAALRVTHHQGRRPASPSWRTRFENDWSPGGVSVRDAYQSPDRFGGAKKL